MSDRPGPLTPSLAPRSVLGAAVEVSARTGLLAVVRPEDDEHARVLAFPPSRRPQDDGPSAA